MTRPVLWEPPRDHLLPQMWELSNWNGPSKKKLRITVEIAGFFVKVQRGFSKNPAEKNGDRPSCEHKEIYKWREVHSRKLTRVC